jgi:ABC-type glycerol-3-phosphate transport system substrate-binding protein
MKKLIFSMLALSMVLLPVMANGAKEDAPMTTKDANKTLVVWSFTDELQGMTNDYYKPAHPDMTIDYSMTPTDQFPSKLDPVLASGSGAPDVFALENAFVRKYIESGLLLNLDDVYAQVKDKMAKYPMDIATYNGHVYGMAWQVCPGALFYRRSLAKKYLGTDDPAKVQAYVSSLDKFIDTARMINTKSNGVCKIVSTTGDMFMPYKGARKQPWIVKDKLVIDPAMYNYMDMAKLLHDEKLEGRAGQWSEGWFAGMKGDLKDEKGNAVEVFSYLLPTWGLHYVLKTNSPATSGDWAMCAGPANYYWGGTWIAAYKGTKNPNAAKEYIRYLATDDDFLMTYAKKSGDTVGNLNVQNAVKDSFSEPYLGGQNHYAQFCAMAKGIDGSLIQGTDQAIEALWSESVAAYQLGEKTKEQAIAEFKDQVETTLGYPSAK